MKKIILILLLFLSTSLYSVYAQAALIALLFGDKVATENFHLSVDIGMNISSLPNLEQGGSTTGLYFGLGTFIKLNDTWALTPEFKPLSPRGATNVNPINNYSSLLSDPSYDISLRFIDVPILIQRKINNKFFISAGPQISFLTGASQISTGRLQNGNNAELSVDVKSTFESIYLSLPLEIGYSFTDLMKGKAADLKIRYNFGLNEMIADSSYGSSNGSTVQIFLSFPFIK